MQIGFIGLGKMGSRMVGKLINDGHDVVVWNRSTESVEIIKKEFKNIKISSSVKELVSSLSKPCIVWTMLPAGEATEVIISEIALYVSDQDIIIDGANENFNNTNRHAKFLAEKNIKFLGIGVSGGIIAAQDGYPLMVGGDINAYNYIKPILDTLANPNGGHKYFGIGGAGHYVKMIHNAIEYGYMQSIGEGFEVLQKSDYNLDLIEVAKMYQRGTLISGFMMDRTVEALEKDPKLEQITGEIGSASGETVWAIEEAKRMDVQLEIIKASLEYRKRSMIDKKIQQSFTGRLVSSLRNVFGGHDVKNK